MYYLKLHSRFYDPLFIFHFANWHVAAGYIKKYTSLVNAGVDLINVVGIVYLE
jgi:hypothetical protein